MMDVIEALKKQRAILKGKITRLETFIRKFDPLANTIKDIKVRLVELDKNWDAYQDIQFKIQVLDSTEEKDLEAEENKYFSVKASMENKLETLSVEDKTTRKSVITKVPVINLPTFNGNYTDWMHFRDVFQSLIIKNDSLSDIQRMHHLIASLSGDAKELITNIPLTSENFTIAWNLLHKRFNNPKLIVQEHVRALLNLPKCNKEAASSLSSIINKVRSNTNAINAIKEITTPVHELIIIQLVLKNIDHTSRRAWELHASNLQEYRLEDLLVFLEEKIHALESINLSTVSSPESVSGLRNEKKVFKDRPYSAKYTESNSFVITQSQTNHNCALCKNKQHTLSKCSKYIELPIVQRLATVRENRLCFNCLRKGHQVKECNSKQYCTKCSKHHHTTLHADKTKVNSNIIELNSRSQSNKTIPNPEETTENSEESYCSFKSKSSQVLLATSLVFLHDNKGESHCCRALLDSASQSNFITETLVDRLKLLKHNNDVPIQGIGNLQSTSKYCVAVTLSSRCNAYTRTISCTVLSKITNELPSSSIDVSNWTTLKNVKLADPTFNEPKGIDLLLGAEIFFEILKATPQVRTPGLPNLIDTKFGWILSGQFQSNTKSKRKQLKQTYLSRSDPLHEQMQQFWNIEEFSVKVLTKTEQLTEKHFQKNTIRDTTGRYQVRRPLRESPSALGNSYEGACKRLLSLEKRFSHDLKLKEDYINTSENPADLISRGATPRLLKDNILWWNGPRVLSEKFIATSTEVLTELNTHEALREEKPMLTLVSNQDVEWDLLTRFSNMTTLQRVTAYCIRFVRNCRLKDKNLRETSSLTSAQLRMALIKIIRFVQQRYFAREFEVLAADLSLSKNNPISRLNPFIDKEGCIRVGGRLQMASISYDRKFQLILPHNHCLTELIIRTEHQRLLHAGQKMLVASLRLKYWIPRIKNALRAAIGKCKVCFTLEAKASKQLMGSLPSSRVQPSRPFLNSGVDYAGPFILKSGGIRSKKTIKAYVAVFVCMVTKVIHLELVSSLSSEAFIAALRRFIGRRGRVQYIFSDNGRNFRGASKHLKELYKFLHKKKNEICYFAANEDFNWHFIPPSAPHFGGLWETGVRSMKFHLTRVMGVRQLTWEEMVTLLCQVESILISRPITPLSDSPDDYSFLTPGHFLTGDGLTSIPESNYSDITFNRLKRWQQLQKCLQQLWKQWSNDYLHTLQLRGKWTTKTNNIKPGSLVLLKENLPPLQWRTAVIEDVHPGKDGLVRVVTIRTASGIIKRPITKLCPFPE